MAPKETADSGTDTWFQHDPFWEAVAPVLFSPQRFAEARAEVPHIAHVLDLRPGHRVLDVFCGVGRYLLPLQEAGFSVLGVDRTRSYVERAQTLLERAAGAATRDSQAQVILSDVSLSAVDIPEFAPFDAAIWLGSSTGYGDSDSDVLRWIRNRLGPDRPLLIDATLSDDLQIESSWEWFDQCDPDKPAEIAAVWRLDHQIVDDPIGNARSGTPARWLKGRWRRWVDGSTQEFGFRYGLYSRTEWIDMLHDTGYANILFPHEIPDFGERTKNWIVARASG